MSPSQPSRREFLQTTAAGLATVGIAGADDPRPRTNDGGVPLRPLGKTGQMVSLLCLGGHASTNPKKMSEALRAESRRLTGCKLPPLLT